MNGEALVPGEAAGPVLFADLGLSFMGGVDPYTGVVTDTHHPLRGESVAGKILAIPSGRGSCSGSLIIFQLLLNGHAPKALVFRHKETILTIGVVIAHELFARGIPVICLAPENFAAMAEARYARVQGDTVALANSPLEASGTDAKLPQLDLTGFHLNRQDERVLAGEFGAAAKIAMRIIIRAARLEGATSLIDVDMAHIDGCFYQGPASLEFARKLCDLGAKVRVPSTMNALCVDRRQWRAQGVAAALGLPSDDLAEAYIAMGVQPTYTCAPYLLDAAPVFGQQIAWAESNAVAFANSVLGARTMKYPEYLDILVAITGRAPNADCHVSEHRRATLRIDVPRPPDPDDAYYAMLGYHIGKTATNEIPVICGLEGLPVTHDDLKGFGAAFATTSAAPMFHILGVTPEAMTLEDAAGTMGPVRHVTVTLEDLEATWRELNSATSPDVDLVSLGNPHFSLTECAALARLCARRRKADNVALIVTCGRDIYEKANAAGYVTAIRDFGGQFLNDTCWCFIGEPVVAREVRNIATNSGKYAHYGPAAVRKGFHFASLARCVEAACTGRVDTTRPRWLAA
jgi:predicted aconitase/predicted aconitase with swiveling domain